MLSNDKIKEFTSAVVPFLHLTTKIPGKAHDGLLKEKGFGGFPSLCFMDAAGEVLHRIPGNQRNVAALQRELENVQRRVSLERAASTDPAAARDLLILKLEMGGIGFAEATVTAASMEFSDAQRATFQVRLVETLSKMKLDDARAAAASVELVPAARARADEVVGDLEIRKAMAPLFKPVRPYNPRTEKPPVIPYEICWDLYASGKLPSDKPSVNSMYWRGVGEIAEKKGDLQAFERSLTKLREAYGASQEAFLRSLQARLDAMRSAAGK